MRTPKTASSTTKMTLTRTSPNYNDWKTKKTPSALTPTRASVKTMTKKRKKREPA
jgi:hypothetical protein